MEELGYQPTLLDQKLTSTVTRATSFMENHGECVSMMDNGEANTQFANVSSLHTVAYTVLYTSYSLYLAIKCGDLDHIQYGSVKITTYTVGSKAHFHCDKGYKLYGEPWRVCQYDGQWGGKYPVCKRKRILSEKCALQ